MQVEIVVLDKEEEGGKDEDEEEDAGDDTLIKRRKVVIVQGKRSKEEEEKYQRHLQLTRLRNELADLRVKNSWLRDEAENERNLKLMHIGKVQELRKTISNFCTDAFLLLQEEDKRGIYRLVERCPFIETFADKQTLTDRTMSKVGSGMRAIKKAAKKSAARTGGLKGAAARLKAEEEEEDNEQAEAAAADEGKRSASTSNGNANVCRMMSVNKL
jgi:hypothetical protein